MNDQSPNFDAEQASRAVRLVVVDDSATMRRLIRNGLADQPGIEVIAEASNAREARDAVKALSPDVMTLDIEMPGMSGLEFLGRLMRGRPMPVIMFSSLTARGSDAALKALSLGAVDCVEKPHFGQAGRTLDHLAELIRVAARARVRRAEATRARPPAVPKGWRWNGKWLLIGSSTGGVDALQTILARFPEDCPPTLITQHMPENFIDRFSARLDASIAPRVRVGSDGYRPVQGEVLIAPAPSHHMTIAPGGETIRLVAGPKRSGHRPSVNELFASAVPYATRMIAAILTGMGSDGALELLSLREAGAHCIGQDRDSSVVYGMPRVAMEMGAVERQLPLADIAGYLLAKAGEKTGAKTP